MVRFPPRAPPRLMVGRHGAHAGRRGRQRLRASFLRLSGVYPPAGAQLKSGPESFAAQYDDLRRAVGAHHGLDQRVGLAVVDCLLADGAKTRIDGRIVAIGRASFSRSDTKENNSAPSVLGGRLHLFHRIAHGETCRLAARGEVSEAVQISGDKRLRRHLDERPVLSLPVSDST